MLEHWLIELLGHVSGLSDAQLKQIEKSLPATKALVDLLNRARPIIGGRADRVPRRSHCPPGSDVCAG